MCFIKSQAPVTCLLLTPVAVKVECISVIFLLRGIAICKGSFRSIGSNLLLLVIANVDWGRKNLRGASESVLSKILSNLSRKIFQAIDIRVSKCFLDDLEAVVSLFSTTIIDGRAVIK